MNQNCFNHPNSVALSICHSCQKHYCKDCLSEGSEYYYCASEPCQALLEKELAESHQKSETKKVYPLFSENRKRWQMLATLSVIVAFITQFFLLSNSDSNPNRLSQFSDELSVPNPNLVENLFGVAGGTVTLLIFPMIPTVLVWAGFKLIGKQLRPKQFMNVYTVCWTITIAISLAGNIYRGNGSTVVHRSNLFNYEPANSEYSVVFASRPTISPMQTELFETLFEGEKAELFLKTNGSFQRAESIELPQSILSFIDKGQALNAVRMYAEYNGLLYPEFEYTENHLGKVVKMRAFKDLQDQSGKIIRATYSSAAYFGLHSAMFLYAGSPSDIFPTSEIIRFLKSIKREH